MMFEHAVVTGGAGFIGSSLAVRLRSAGLAQRVTALDNLKRRGSELQLARLQAAGVDFLHGDTRMSEDIESSLPCTPKGIIELIERHGISLRGKEVVVIGRGTTVGRSIGLLLTRRAVNATVTLCHTGTADLSAHTRGADVIVAAAGVPGLVTGDMVKEGVVLIDVGVSRVTDPETGKSRVAGDIDPDATQKASWYSPNPGGVGPMTRAMLLANVVDSAERAAT